MSARGYITKLIKIRKYLISAGKSKQDQLEMERSIQRLERWLGAWPRANDRQVAAFLNRNMADVLAIMPGTSCPAHNKLIQELNQYTYEEANS